MPLLSSGITSEKERAAFGINIYAATIFAIGLKKQIPEYLQKLLNTVVVHNVDFLPFT